MKNLLIIVLTVLPKILISQGFYSETTSYEYDNLNRLIKVIYNDSTVYEYTYDELGNRQQINVTQPKDIYLENATVSLATATIFQEIHLSVDFNYTGLQHTWDLPDFVVYYYLSEDCNIDPWDDEFISRDTASLGINNSSEHETASFYPPIIPSGDYKIIFYGDYYDALPNEDTDTNNIICRDITIINTLSTDEEIASKVSVFPNPVEKNLTIANEFDIPVTIQIFDISEKLVFEAIAKTGNTAIDMSHFAKGTYAVAIIAEEGTKIEKIVKL